jgi:hypothetical protein
MATIIDLQSRDSHIRGVRAETAARLHALRDLVDDDLSTVDRKWINDQEIHAEPYDDILYGLIDRYARIPPERVTAERFGGGTLLRHLQKFANDIETPEITRCEAMVFLRAPDDWPSVRYWRAYGTYEGLDEWEAHQGG